MQRLVYILAASHSGSTLLAMLLGSHPQACTVGELKARDLENVNKYRCSCGVLLKQCAFWSRVRERMADKGLEFDITRAATDIRNVGGFYTRTLMRPLHRHHLWECVRDAALWLSPCWRSELPLRQRRDAALVKSVGEVMAKPVVVDSSKVALRLKYLLRNPGLNVSVVHLIRDGRAVALTYMDQRQFGGGMTPIPSTDGRCIDVPMEEAARRWRRSNEEAECVLARLDPSRWSRVRYEDYAAEPRRVLEELFEFLGLDPAQATLNFRSDGVHVIGNVMRLDTSREITVDDRWRRVLTVDQLAAFDRAAGRLNRRYGYE